MELRDGRSVTARRLVPSDRGGLQDLVARTSDANLYLRFFGNGRRQAERFITQLCAPETTSIGWVLLDHERLIGVADVEPGGPGEAEIAFLVDDHEHEQGVATLLLTAAADSARRDGMTRLSAVVLSVNAAMLRVFEDSGYPVRKNRCGTETELWLDVTRPPHLGPHRCSGSPGPRAEPMGREAG